jgi:hypothetical protein
LAEECAAIEGEMKLEVLVLQMVAYIVQVCAVGLRATTEAFIGEVLGQPE